MSHMADLPSAKRIAEFIAPLRVKPRSTVRLPHDYDPGYTGGIDEGPQASALMAEGVELLGEYQARMAAQDTYSLLIVLQGMDGSGKDGTIKHVMSGVNPQGVEVHAFKAPSTEDLDHDFLWRHARVLPPRGHIGIFNRSHYEEVLVVRVHPEILETQQLPPKVKGTGIWRRRFRDINAWERYLVDQGVRIVKLFLNVSKEEQRRRFLDRIDEPDKNWKFAAGDIGERARWDAYQEAYADVLSRTSTPWAPWHVIPADHKWFARLASAAVIGHALYEIDPQYPTLTPPARVALTEARAALLAEGPRPDR
jgi:PPK2 family polyphosphate:nucleotide phosphotransferase